MLEAFRKGWNCDCAGPVKHEPFQPIEDLKDSMARVCGARPDTCPWRAYSDPLVVDVLRVNRWFESGQVSLRAGHDPPYVLIEGLEELQGSLNLAKGDKMKVAKQAREKSKRNGK